jgi:polyhydroxyalkanoate synthesis repressor PhaR
MSQPLPADPDAKASEPPPVVVKKYANRRLYNTESSSYITLDTLAEMVREGRDFVVFDAKTGDDITRGVLTQIIVEEEGKGKAMLPTGFLRQLIGFYGDSVQNLVPRYLEQALASFARQQEQMRQAVQQTMGSFFPFGMEEVGRQNLAMMERAMSLFAPFARPGDADDARTGVPVAPQDEMEALRAEVELLRGQLARLQNGLVAAKPEAAPTPLPLPAKKSATGKE